MGKKIIIALCSGLIIIGLMIALIGFALGGRPGGFSIVGGKVTFITPFSTTPLWSSPGWFRGWTDQNFFGGWWGHENQEGWQQAKPQAPGEKQILDNGGAALSSIDLHITAGNVYIKAGDTYRVEVEGPLQVRQTQEENSIKLEALYNNIHSIGWANNSPTPRFTQNGVDVTTTYTITVPGDCESITLYLEQGALEVDTLKIEQLEVENDAGTTLIKNLQAGSGSFDTDAGVITLENSQIKESSFQADAGIITISALESNESTITMGTGVANIDIKVENQLTATCLAGSIAITHPRPQQYSWASSVDLGTISIDGKSYGFDTRMESDSSASPFFDLQVDAGTISLSFT